MSGQARRTLPATCIVMPAAGGYSVCWRTADSYEFKRIVGRFHAAFPGSRWQPDEKAWFVPEEEAAELRAWTDRLFGDSVEWITADSEPAGHTQRQQAPRASAHETAERAAYDALWVRPGAPRAVVLAAYRAMSMSLHPDHGGSHDAMVTLTAARDLLLKKPP